MYGKSYSQQGQDVHFAIGDTGVKLLFGCILALGIWALIGYYANNAEETKSSAWPTESATLKEIGSRGFGVPIIGRFLPISVPFATYTYTVDRKEYPGKTSYGPSLSFVRLFSYKAPKPKKIDEAALTRKLEEAERAALSRGEKRDFKSQLDRSFATAQELAAHPDYAPVKVRYELSHPENSVLDPDVMQSGKSQLYSALILTLLGGGLLGGMIMHQNLTAPDPNDPSLNIDAALAAQRRRRS